MIRDDYILKLNDPKKKKRLSSAVKLGKLIKKEGKRKAQRACCGFIHSAYSFSPYTPAMAAYMVYNNGLSCAGMVDTGTLSGGEEFLSVCRTFGVSGAVGVGYTTLLPKPYRKLCNIFSRDYHQFVYLAAFGIPENAYGKMDKFLTSYRAEREECNRKILAQINSQFRGLGVISYEEDVLEGTKAVEGGAVTRSHVMLALAKRVIKMAGTGAALVDYLAKVQKISLSSREEKLLLSASNINYEYDLCAILTKKLKVDDEKYTSKIHQFTGATLAAGGLVFYPLNEKDVVEGGEKYIDDLIATLKQLSIHGVAYQSANITQHLSYLEDRLLAEGLMGIDGNNIHSARDVLYTGLMTPLQEKCFYALVGNAYLAGLDPMDAFYGPRTERRFPAFSDRLRVFEEVGKKLAKEME